MAGSKNLLEKQLVELGVYPPFAQWLSEMELPDWRQAKGSGVWPRIEVGGDSMRIGKTTAVKVIGEELEKLGVPVELSLEDWESNPYLKSSYEKLSEDLLESQMWFAKRKYEQLVEANDRSARIQDVNPEMDYCFAVTNVIMGRLSLKQFEKYVGFYRALNWEKLAVADLLVYLTGDDEILTQRANRSKRSFEKVEADYFLVMKAVNQQWLSGINGRPVLIVDTSKLNFAKEEKAKKQLGEMVIKELTKNNWRIQKKGGKK